MRPRKPKAIEPQKLTAGFVADLQAAWSEHGKEILDALRTQAPTKFAEILGRLAVAERLSPAAPATDFNSAQSVQDIGRKLLQSIGFNEPDDVSVAAALEANATFIARLEAIRDKAQGNFEIQ
jgi:hypothetical protein